MANDKGIIEELLHWTSNRVADKSWQNKRFSKLLAFNQQLFSNQFIIKITGTNGKGSTAAMLSAALVASGKKVGLFTSPHLISFTERFRLDGKEINIDLLTHYAHKLKPFLLNFVQQHGPNYLPSFYEILILIALNIFHQHAVDVAIYEAGVGGYNDAVALLPSQLSIITTVALDHQAQLGPTILDIAADKAGIASANTQLVLGPQITKQAKTIIHQDAYLRNIKVIQATTNNFKATPIALNGYDIQFTYQDQNHQFNLPLLGNFQLNNLATVIVSLQTLLEKELITNLTPALSGLKYTIWPGRLEYVSGYPNWIFDSAHNESALAAICDNFDQFTPYHNRILLYGASQDKNYKACLAYLPAIAPQIYIVDGFYHAVKANYLATLLPSNISYCGPLSTKNDIMNKIINNTNYHTKTIIVLGSVFLVGHIKEILNKRPPTADHRPPTNDKGQRTKD